MLHWHVAYVRLPTQVSVSANSAIAPLLSQRQRNIGGEVWRKAKEDKQEAGIGLQEIRVSLDELVRCSAWQAPEQVIERELAALE